MKEVIFLNMDKMMSKCSNCPLSGTAKCDFDWSKALADKAPCSEVKDSDVIDKNLVEDVETDETLNNIINDIIKVELWKQS